MDWFDLFSKLLQEHSGEMLILALSLVIVLTLLAVLPFLLRHNQRKAELRHRERLQALEKGLPLPVEDDRARAAGRTALFVPIMVMMAAAAVTCFLVSSHAENLFAVSLAVWVVAGVVSLTAITGGVALIGRLAQIQAGVEDEPEEEPVEEDQFTP
jgi:uncharacterized membrane protein YbhN (UPF0104 family)